MMDDPRCRIRSDILGYAMASGGMGAPGVKIVGRKSGGDG
jgi:hypothetical protein